MKWKFLIIWILLLSITYACNRKHFVDKTWVSSTWTETLTPSQYKKFKEILKKKKGYKHFEVYEDSIPIHPIPEKLIFKFKKDSLHLTHLKRGQSKKYMKQSFGYTYKKDSISLTQNNKGGISFKIEQLSKEKLILTSYLQQASYLTPLKKITFQPLKKFPRKKSIKDIESFLVNNTFLINNAETEIFFQKPSKYGGGITLNKSNKSLNLKSSDRWYLIDIDQELFLAVGAELIQIVAVQENKIKGYLYGEKNKEISIERITSQ